MHQEFVVFKSTVPPVKYCFVLRVNQTAGMLATQKTKLVYASISLCLDIIKIHMVGIVLALVKLDTVIIIFSNIFLCRDQHMYPDFS